MIKPPDEGLVLAVIQARMASKRLPAKVLQDVSGKPVLLWVVERISRAREIDELVVATSNNPFDNAIEHFCDEYAIPVRRGEENDVLERFYKVCCEFKPETIVRITADCPLIDYEVVDRVITTFMETDCDYASNTLNRTYPRGLDTEVFTFKTLERAWIEAKLPSEREHVTPYIWKHPDIFTLVSVEDDEDNSRLRLTLDVEEDLEFIREIYNRINDIDEFCGYKKIIELLKDEPHLLNINADVEGDTGYKKSLEQDDEYLKGR